MDRFDILKQIEEVIDLSFQLDNIFIHNKLSNIREALVKEWSESDLYFQIITEELKKT